MRGSFIQCDNISLNGVYQFSVINNNEDTVFLMLTCKKQVQFQVWPDLSRLGDVAKQHFHTSSYMNDGQ